MLEWLASFVIPAFATKMLIGPKWSTACWMHDEIESSSEMSPWTLKTLGSELIGFASLRSWAVILQPAASLPVQHLDLRSYINFYQPSNSLTIAEPIPPLAPVTKAW